ncbi:hypothetical protein DL762_007743 [Monosporascus cannonballus]|uniref:Rhodopsin domain-containing protein n=1 Tax=Monosporascus cannonballus TaxID=155416 RepID=A0ABY0GYG3_9PEZI|nr:hypothetical protein DL762_007743 [Monosporascus cannonballus]
MAGVYSTTGYGNSGEPKPLVNEKETVYGTLVTFVAVQWLCVILRLWSRFKARCLGYDDAFVSIASAFATVGSIFVCRTAEDGLGERFAEIGYENRVSFQQNYYIALLSYSISTTFTKLCLLAQYIRMFDRANPLRRVCWGFLFLTSIWGIAFIIISVVPCFPISDFWYRGEGTCYGFGSIEPHELAGTYTVQTATNMILDLIVLAIPVPLYFQKSTPWKTRMGIGALLLLGVTVNILSIWRLQTIAQSKAATYPVLDPTWYGPKSIVLAAIEVNLASICASIPVFWPMISQALSTRAAKIFVTQEGHVVHQHRRLSRGRDGRGDDGYDGGNDDGDRGGCYELRDSESGTGAAGSSESSLHLVRSSTSHNRPNPSTTAAHYNDKYVANLVTPLGLQKDIAAEAEIKSDGQEGFEREQRRHFGRGGTLQSKSFIGD